ncbi:hypothetical protein H3N56_02605 [Cetobacterium sp. 2A]|uniref:hypothetical protein n=1 Tax=Cetobacterium sp. 2A TaxID=2754723 RepID=UPI00163C6D81|nr:hypothetical protein [Cetobacterium sp. 2A]MBC2855384.1 hypothetical protein [Cetobacterium sp. 2A]
MRSEIYYCPRKEITAPNGRSYIFSETEYLIVVKEFNATLEVFPKYDPIGKEIYSPCIRKELADKKIIEDRKSKIKKLEKIIEKIKKKRNNILEIFPLEILHGGEYFEMDRWDYYLRGREIRAEILLKSISSSTII